MKRRALALATTAALAAALSCGGPRPGAPVRVDGIYVGLTDPLPRVDASMLSGFRVLIDPGHGGTFRGTVGQDSLEETHVNLGVSLYLWGLLREAGADVHLTRAIDRDFLSVADSALASDLQVRVDMVDSLAPDLFISIHHNAQPERDPEVNRVETYYKAGDPASFDLATSIHRHLMRNLGIEVGEVRQGNYFVLRNVAVPAVLGESSYLTHPPVEDKLRLSHVQQMEAQAYFLGILDYCRRGLPRVAAIEPADSVLAAVPTIVCRFEDRGGLGIDPDGVTVTVNGEPARVRVAADGSRASLDLPWDTPNGAYEVVFSARNLRGNTTPQSAKRFTLAHPPASASILADPVPRTGGVSHVRARVLDRRGIPVADGTRVVLSSPALTTTLETTVAGGSMVFAADVPGRHSRPVPIALECDGVRFTSEIPVSAREAAPSQTIFIRDAATGRAIETAASFAADSMTAPSSPGGLVTVAPGDTVRVTAPGYRPVTHAAAGTDTLVTSPWFNGALLGRRFVLDPQGGRPSAVGVGRLGLSASHVNLRVATYLEGFLRAAGADVRLTRRGDEVRLVEDVARLTNTFRADLYIEIRHPATVADSGRVVRSYHFPGSATGEAIARTLGESLARRLAVPFAGPATTVTYPLQQTACPAVVVAAPSIADVDEELRLDSAAYLREQAYAILLGLLLHYRVVSDGELTVEVALAPRAEWSVTLDDTWTLVTGESGTVTFGFVTAGGHEIVLRRGDTHLRRRLTTTDTKQHVRIDSLP